MQCPFCTHSADDFPRVTDYPTGERQYYACRECGSILLHPLPSAIDNTAFEKHENVVEMQRSDELRQSYFARRLDLVERHAPSSPPRRLCEFGCGSGELLRLAGKRGWTVSGIELSPGLAEVARAKNPDATIHLGSAETAPKDQLPACHAVVALDVLEHVLSPDRLLKNAGQCLASGGLLLLQTPNARSLRSRLRGPMWNMLIPEYHFHLPSSKGLRTILERHGFAILHLTTASGSGAETGAAATLSTMKEAFLRFGNLGNALLAVARKK